jgi:leucine dehydrogenase
LCFISFLHRELFGGFTPTWPLSGVDMSVWISAEYDAHEQVCFFSDEVSGLRAIVAIHSTVLGPAAGGTRFKPYGNDALAVDDALRLSRAMSYKSALAGLPIGGGKAVIIGDPALLKNRELLHAYGAFLNRIGSHFATGEDVGMSVADMDIVSEVTPFVGGTTAGQSDLAAHTATGVIHGLRSVLEKRFGRSDFAGVRVALQGLGAVGWGVAARLHAAGAKLLVADVRAGLVARAHAEFGATGVPTAEIHRQEVDIFVPCALGGVINETSIGEIRAGAVAGAANNQLASPEAGVQLAARNILFAPDYVINAGGIISGFASTVTMPGREAVELAPLDQALAAIGTRLSAIFERSALERTPPEVTSEIMAREIIGRHSTRAPTS